MAGPKFLQRLARLPEVINVLTAYPDGLSLRRLAAQFGVDEETMREDLVTYLDLESWGWSFDIFRRPALEFVQPEGDDDPTDGTARTVVRIVPDATPGLGAEHLSAGDLATLYTAGAALLEVDPDDDDLAGALAVIAETMYGEPAATPYVGDWNRHVKDLQDAQEQRRKVRIVYSRAWRPGVTDRVIEPLRLVQTRRGLGGRRRTGRAGGQPADLPALQHPVGRGARRGLRASVRPRVAAREAARDDDRPHGARPGRPLGRSSARREGHRRRTRTRRPSPPTSSCWLRSGSGWG